MEEKVGVPIICLKELQVATLGPCLPGALGEAEEQVLDRGRTMTRDPQVPQVGFHLPYLFATQNLYNESCVTSLEERQNFFPFKSRNNRRQPALSRCPKARQLCPLVSIPSASRAFLLPVSVLTILSEMKLQVLLQKSETCKVGPGRLPGKHPRPHTITHRIWRV